MIKKVSLSFFFALLITPPLDSYASNKSITIAFPTTIGAGRVITIGRNGKSSSASKSASSRKVTISSPDSLNRIFFSDSTGKITSTVVLAKCSAGSDKSYKSCNYKKVISLIKAGTSLKVSPSGSLLRATLKGDKFAPYAKLSSLNPSLLTTSLLTQGRPAIVGKSLGIKLVHALADTSDSDGDGLPNSIDADSNNNGVINNYDSTTPSSTPSGTSSTFNLFSNLKLELDQSLNVNAGGLTQAAIDSALLNNQTLAIQVVGGTTDTTELDCGALSYCSLGGTGKTLSENKAFPAEYDSDGNGYGTISKGATGDFQLKTGSTASQIGAGDTFVEHFTSSTGAVSDAAGMLNFVFNTTPALKTISTSAESGYSFTVDYASTPRSGSRQNCFSAPATGDITVTVTGWRPQRPGNSALGEATYVDIGKSTILFDIPNGACSSPTGPCAPQGPGNCTSTSYSTTDANLTLSANGLADGKSDLDSDASNTYSFSANLGTCLRGAPSGTVSWNAGQTLFIDLQFKSQYGDNAAQKFCITRRAS